ncbi:MAG: polysaccharide deacetylase family protein [Coleofasciculaceae cyanobacterium SM2_1_6]|nr:polysaccharide deacetylase family protein [Coleofasciculaceae cyanobacterium SM2_1_6]
MSQKVISYVSLVSFFLTVVATPGRAIVSISSSLRTTTPGSGLLNSNDNQGSPSCVNQGDSTVGNGDENSGNLVNTNNADNSPTKQKKTTLLKQALNLKRQVDKQWQYMVMGWASEAGAYLQPAPWPQIHQQARQAKVPVMMYHDVLPEKEVPWDNTPQEIAEHFRLIKAQGLTPISLQQLVTHLHTGLPLPEKPIVLTFDDGYGGHYEYVYKLMQEYNYPVAFSVYTDGVGKEAIPNSDRRPGGPRTHVSWEQLQEMAANPLVEIISHSVTHPLDMREQTDAQITKELVEAKQILESKLGVSVDYFTYPVGKNDDRVRRLVKEAGYVAAFTMHEDPTKEQLAGESENLLAIGRWGQSRLLEALENTWGGAALVNIAGQSGMEEFDFTAPIKMQKVAIDNTNLILISGGRPVTIHARSRYQVPEILANTGAVAGVDGGFFSLEFLDSNQMIGPVLSQNTKKFVPGKEADVLRIKNRPLVLISKETVKFIPFDVNKHNEQSAIEAEMPDVTDAFVGAAWLVRDGAAQSAQTFGNLFDFDAERHRAFWGINKNGQPVIGVSVDPVDSVSLGKILAKAGYYDAVMLDSGASTSLAYKGDSLVGYTPRPVPHVVALMPSDTEVMANCSPNLSSKQTKQ